MNVMAKKPAKKRFPSREKIKYVYISVDLWNRLKAVAESQERSVAYIARKAVEKFLDDPKR